MRTSTAAAVSAVSLFVLAYCPCGAHGRIVLNTKAVNPADQARPVTIHSRLPAGLKTNAIISLDGMGLRRDSTTSEYYTGAFKQDSAKFAEARGLIAERENMPGATGQVPARAAQPASAGNAREGSQGQITLRIVAMNLLGKGPQKVQVRRDLPPEIEAGDIIDAGGLQVGTDTEKGSFYVCKNDLELKPNESVVYSVVIRDKWNVNGDRIEQLKAGVVGLFSRYPELRSGGAARDAVGAAIRELEVISKSPGPRSMDDNYIEYYREQTALVDRLESAVAGIEKALAAGAGQPGGKYVWISICSVSVFLLVLGVAAFLRTRR